MRILRPILAYLFWTVLALFFGIAYMRLVLGPNNVSEDGLGYLLHLFYDVGLIHVGIWIGGAIALCFLLVDIFYVRRKLKNNPKKTAVRFAILLAIAVLVAMVHYLLEKVIDVI